MSGTRSYGKTLPDQFDRIASLFTAHLTLITDVREFHKERVALEREYAGKLQALAKKAAEKKAKTEMLVSVGAEPTKVWDDRTLQQNTLLRAYGEIIAATTSAAQDHVSIADVLTVHVVDAFKTLERQNDNLAKKEIQSFNKLLSDRDQVYSERLKCKQKYDDECRDLETHRQKQARAQDDRHADRAAKQYDQQRDDMLNSKNLYLISIIKANRIKAKFYDEELPDFEDTFQGLQSHLVKKLTTILLYSQALQRKHLDGLKERLTTVENTLGLVNPAGDQELFMDHNIRSFVSPADWTFEPCATHYDTGELSVEAGPKTFLQNKLIRCQAKIEELTPLIEARHKELDGLQMRLASNASAGDTDVTYDNYLETKQRLSSVATAACVVEAEIHAIVDAIGDDEGTLQPHSFKGATFSIPAHCSYCKSSIWGLSKQGKTCQLCGLSVHTKCELKVPADCKGSEARSKPTSVLRTTSHSSDSKSAASSIIRSSTTSTLARASQAEGSSPLARVLFDFEATSEFELDVSEGTLVHVYEEEEDGSGWIKVVDDRGSVGLVPTSYIELVGPTDIKKSAVVQQRKLRVRGLYDYEAQGPDEISVKPGELIDLTDGPMGGSNYGADWWEGINTLGRKGIFPSNYVERV